MASYTKKCPNCGNNNPPASVLCDNCNFDIKAVFPEQLIERFRVCEVCGEKNDELARVCIKCKNEELYRSPVQSNKTSPKAMPRATTIMEEQTIVLNEISKKIILSIPSTGGLIGRGGTIGAIELEAYDTVSRHHLKINFTGSWIVEDLGSANGTKINGRRISPGTAENLSIGDILSIANLNFTVSG